MQVLAAATSTPLPPIIITYLTDPGSVLHQILTQLQAWGPLAGPLAILDAIGVVVLRRWLRRRYQQRLTAGA
ncbi:hypothetical protein, partial [Frankia sp. AvcI1]